MRTLVIGRSPHVDVVVVDDTVAKRHAEVVVTEDGGLYLTDCATRTGTWRLAGARGSDEVWEKVRQRFVGRDEPLRLGSYRCTLGELIGEALAKRPPGDQGDGGDHRHGGAEHPRGPVERDPRTGEIVRKRL